MANFLTRRAEFLTVLGACISFAVLWALVNGRDLNWDFLNYHLYAGYAADGGRFNKDYFAASIQSYLPGYVYVPLYLAIKAGWDAWTVQLLLALQAVPTMLAAWYLACRLSDSREPASMLWRGGMLVAACASPMFLVEVGTSFADVPTAAFVILALALVLPDPLGKVRPFALAGIAAGVAIALKMTNGPMAAGIAVVCLFSGGPRWQDRLKAALIFSASLTVTFAVIYGYWGWLLHQNFGNPFFPFFLNGWFRSPEFFRESITLDRFIPLTLAEFALRPVYMLDLVANVYTETRAPDARYLALLVLALAYLVARRCNLVRPDPTISAALCWIAVTWVLWLLTSGNGRYAVVLAMIVGATCVAITKRLWRIRGASIAAVKATCMALAILQGVTLCSSTTFRWDGRDAVSAPYFAPRIPQALLEQPHTIVSIGMRSISWLAPFVHPDSVFSSPTGQYLIDPESAAGLKLLKLIRSGRPVLIAIEDAAPSPSPLLPPTKRVTPYTDLFGLQVETSACLKVNVDTPPLPSAPQREFSMAKEHVVWLCPAIPDGALMSTTVQQYREMDRVMAFVEDACPALFRPKRPQTVCNENQCARFYVSTDVSLKVYRLGEIAVTGFGGVQPGLMGNVSDVLAGQRPECPPRPGRYRPFTAGDAVIGQPR